MAPIFSSLPPMQNSSRFSVPAIETRFFDTASPGLEDQVLPELPVNLADGESLSLPASPPAASKIISTSNTKHTPTPLEIVTNSFDSLCSLDTTQSLPELPPEQPKSFAFQPSNANFTDWGLFSGRSQEVGTSSILAPLPKFYSSPHSTSSNASTAWNNLSPQTPGQLNTPVDTPRSSLRNFSSCLSPSASPPPAGQAPEPYVLTSEHKSRPFRSVSEPKLHYCQSPGYAPYSRFPPFALPSESFEQNREMTTIGDVDVRRYEYTPERDVKRRRINSFENLENRPASPAEFYNRDPQKSPEPRINLSTSSDHQAILRGLANQSPLSVSSSSTDSLTSPRKRKQRDS